MDFSRVRSRGERLLILKVLSVQPNHIELIGKSGKGKRPPPLLTKPLSQLLFQYVDAHQPVYTRYELVNNSEFVV